jgi:hypothetical protein
METGFENKHSQKSPNEVKEIMNRFGRSRVLEVYFARLDERLPEVVPSYEADLYLLPLSQIKEFLLEQGRHDPLLKKILETKF